MIILAIESSCDETGLALLEVKQSGKKNPTFKVLANVLNSQIDIHQVTHGVVPEVAARRHVEMFPHLVNELIKKSKIKLQNIDLIAVTNGPGLIGSLLVGIEAAKVLAATLNKPLIGINHLKAHLHANFFNLKSNQIEDIKYPALALLISGGHTELIKLESMNKFSVIGDTLDDAVGESFDKVARLLKLPYPGGPSIAKLALTGNDQGFTLPMPLKTQAGFNFSYSGLKTAVRTLIVDNKTNTEQSRADLAASFQRTAVEHVLDKTTKAIRAHHAKTLIVAGGVSANQYLRKRLTELYAADVDVRIPEFFLCTDNALMIAMSAAIEYLKNPKKVLKSDWRKINVDPGMNI